MAVYATVWFTCPKCSQTYQLKSRRDWSKNKIVNAAYSTMIAAIRNDNTPNLFLLQYSATWSVQNMLLIPHFFITESIIEKRRPLGPLARRAGWIGCNILLKEIPKDGKLGIVLYGIEIEPNKTTFTLSDIYRFDVELAALHPDNRNVHAKIRQQLQVLRNLGFLVFTERGHYSLYV